MATNIKLKRSATQGAVPGTSDIELGELALNTYDGKMYMKKTVSGSSSIVELTGSTAASSSAFAHETYKYTASGSQTTFTGSDADSKTLSYTAGQIQVFLNGVLLDAADFTATNGTSVVLGSAASANDILLVTAYQGTNPFDYFKYTATNAQTTFSGNDDNSESLIYTTGNVHVYLNGVLLDATDYTATSGTSVVLASGASTGDILVIYEFNEIKLDDVSSDSTPQLGGNLDVNGHDIVSASNGNIDIKPNGSGNIVLDNHTWPNSDGSSGQFLKTNGSGTLSWDTVSSAADDISTGDAAVSIATSAGNITIDAQGNDTDIIFKGTDNSSDITMLTLDGSDAGTAIFNHDIKLGDNSKVHLGAGTDFSVYHTGSHGYVENNTGDLVLLNNANDKDIIFQSDDGAGSTTTYFYLDGSEAAHDGSSTTATYTRFPDLAYLSFGDSKDYNIRHHSNGHTYVSGSSVRHGSNAFRVMNLADSETLIEALADGAVTLYHDNTARIATSSTGATVTGHLTIGGSNNELRFYEGSNYVGFEAPALSGDQIWVLPAADGSANQVIKTDGSGNLSFADAAATVSGLTDTTISSVANGDYLIYNGSAWVNQAQASNATINTMTGDNSDTTLSLSRAPLSENAVHIYWDGVYQHKDNWSLSGSTVTFDTAPGTGVKVEAVVGSQTNILYGNDVAIDKMTGDASDTTLSLSVTPSNENHVNVYFDGVYQSKDNYTLSGSTITFSTAPPTGVLVEAVSNQAVSVGTATGIAASALTGLSEVTAADADHVLIYDASGSALKKALVSDFAKNTTEEIQDIIGGMVSSNTETGISVTYEDGDGTLDFALGAAQTTITSLLATDIKIGEDDQTKIDFETADEIHFYAANVEQVYLGDNIFGPQSDSDVDLGSSSVRWKDAYVDSLTAGNMALATNTLTSTGTFIIDSDTDITLDADGGDIRFKDGGTTISTITNSSNSLQIKVDQTDADFIIKGDDGGSEVTPLFIDMSAGGYLGVGTTTANKIVNFADPAQGGEALKLHFEASSSTDKWGIYTYDRTNSHYANMSLGENAIWINGADKRVGINQTSPSAALHITGSGDTKIIIEDGSAEQSITAHSGGLNYGVVSGDSHTFVIGGTDAAFIDSGSARIKQTAITSSSNSVAWDAKAAANAYHITTENTTFAAPSNAVEGAIISVELAQGGTARTIAWNTVFEFAASTAPTVTATANKTDIFTFRYNGSVWQEIGRVQNMAQT